MQAPWTQKVQAIRALAGAFPDLKGSFPDFYEKAVKPQLVASIDPNWQVRAELVDSLEAYSVRAPEVLRILIQRLSDTSDEVRNRAVIVLGHFGISSKDALRQAMIEVGLIRAPPPVKDTSDPFTVCVKKPISKPD